jgi:hypothetical protein
VVRAATREKPDLTLFVPGWLPAIYATGTGGHTYANIFAGFRDLVRLMAMGHLLRLLRHWPAEIAGGMVPPWISIVALVLAACLTL